MTVQEDYGKIEVLERRVKGYKNSYDFSVKNANPHRQAKYRDSIRATELQIKELEKKDPNAIQRLQDKITDLHIKIDELTNKELLSKLKGIELQKQINEFAKPIPEPEPEQKPIPEIIPESIPIPEAEIKSESISEPEIKSEPKPEGKISCPYCERLVNGERGLRTHLSRYCTKKEEVEIS